MKTLEARVAVVTGASFARPAIPADPPVISTSSGVHLGNEADPWKFESSSPHWGASEPRLSSGNTVGTRLSTETKVRQKLSILSLVSLYA